MKLLFIHQNFPAQFVHLAPAMAARGHDVRALTAEPNQRPSTVPMVRYRWADGPQKRGFAQTYAQMAGRGAAVARAGRQMRARGYHPDVIFAHPGWGEALFLRDVWPEARLILYAEWMYNASGFDTGFDPEFSRTGFEDRLSVTARASYLIQSMVAADAALCPTRFQASTFPPLLRDRLMICHDGVDMARIHPDNGAEITLPNGRILRAGDEVLTFASRVLEPYRGIHTFLRALPAVLAARPNAHVVIVGQEDGRAYGPLPPVGSTWAGRFLSEVAGLIDPNRVHFMGRVPHNTFVRVLQVSRVHAYLSYPFVPGWSLVEAMAAGAVIVGSDTPPLREMIGQGREGLLVDFFDVEGWGARLSSALADPAGHAHLGVGARVRAVRDYDLRQRLAQIIAFVESQIPGGVPPQMADECPDCDML